MLGLLNSEKRGRPDITHLTLLEILSTPLNKEGRLRLYVHTVNDYVITVDERTKLPRNYDRFVGLIERVFLDGKVPPEGKPLLSMEKMGITQLLESIQPTKTVAFSSVGDPATIQEVCRNLAKESRPTVVVGGFAHGHFSRRTLDSADTVVSIYHKPLDAWVVASRIVYEYEVESSK